VTTQHEVWCPSKVFGHTDAARRMADTFNLHRMADQYGAINRWIAVRLSDGTSDHTLYDTKSECVRHQHGNEQWYSFIKIVPTTMNVCEAEVKLRTDQRMYDAGFRMADPDSRTGGAQVINRLTVEDALAQMRGLSTNLLMPE
jgi:hypothetical protein